MRISIAKTGYDVYAAPIWKWLPKTFSNLQDIASLFEINNTLSA